MQHMVKLFLFIFSFLIISCYNNKTYNADLEMYIEYLDYIKMTSKGKIGISPLKNQNKDIEFHIKDFYKVNTKVLIFHNRKLNIQYFIFYSNWIEKNQNLFLKGRLVHSFNSELINVAASVEDFVISKFEDRTKKIFIGFEAGGAVANIIASRFDKNKDFEVITFGTPAFSSGFKPKFTSTNMILEEDEIAKLDPRCCKKFETETTGFSSKKSTKGAAKIEAYQDAIRKSISL